MTVLILSTQISIYPIFPISKLTMTFERVSTAESEVVAEHFTINASELIPGLYRLEIEIRDSQNNSRASSVRNFRLVD